MNDYEIGDQIRLTAVFTDANGAAADPTTVTCSIRRTAGDSWSFAYPGSVTKSATGTFSCDWTCSNDGIYEYRWAGTGAVVAAGEAIFRVLKSAFA
jgi:hypothetical protein